MSNEQNELVITRIFDVPRELMWKAWSEPERLKKWWGQPKGATMPVCKVDFRVGGVLHFQVVLPDGTAIWGKGVYREIVEPERLVFEDCFSDEAGSSIVSEEMPMALVTATFEDIDGQTKLTVRHSGMATEAHTLELYQSSWNQTLDLLAESLK